MTGGTNAKTAGIYLGVLDSTERTQLLADISSPAFAQGPTGKGYILFARSGTLMAQQFDAGQGALAGEAFPIAEQVGMDGQGRARFSVSGQWTAGL